MGFEVDDIEAFAAHLRGRGVTLEAEGLTEVEGDYPSKGGRGERAIWFRDSEGNVLGRTGAVTAPYAVAPRY